MLFDRGTRSFSFPLSLPLSLPPFLVRHGQSGEGHLIEKDSEGREGPREGEGGIRDHFPAAGQKSDPS